ncbi:MAG: mechanosensitive ion channel [Francisellaceae bacterium]|nr:mechanosensitive ion channel [Francisellaceae bacterium]
MGIGVGLGLQQITSNFISGFILSFEKAIEPGHLIEMSDSVFGLVESTNARYTLIKAYDGRRIIVPNEYFISQKVTNWTYTDCEARVDFTVGVAYESDLELAISIVESISSAHPKSSSEKKSKCYVKEFGESAIQLFCTFWVKDITLGRLGIKSDIILEVHKQFKENNIEISYPKRVVHIRKEENT